MSHLGAQPVGPPTVSEEPPRGVLTVTSANSPEPHKLRNVTLRNLGGRAFLVGTPGEGRQLAASPPVLWIPVDVVVYMDETLPPQ
jgi:hypothetical protein